MRFITLILLSMILSSALAASDESRPSKVSRGVDPFGGFTSMGPPIPMMTYEGRYSPGDKAPSFTENKLNLLAPMYKTETNSVSLLFNNTYFHLGDRVVLDSGKRVSRDLYRMETGAQYHQQLPEKKSWGLRGTVGYAGDKPSLKSNDLTYNFIGNYGFPGSGKGYWMFMLFFSNNGPLGNYIPIPGVSYLYKTENFTAMLGFPIFSLRWTPVSPWSFSLGFYAFNIRSEIAYGSSEKIQFFSCYYMTRQNYIPQERENTKDRLTIEEKKVALGFRKTFWDSVQGEFQLGPVFDRSIYIGHGRSGSDKKSAGNVSIPSEWYASLNLKVKF